MPGAVVTLDRFPQFSADAEAKMARGIFTAVLIIERKAASRAPFKYGMLRNSIGSHSEGLYGVCYADAWYALYQEGNPYNRHFLESSLDETMAQFPAILGGV